MPTTWLEASSLGEAAELAGEHLASGVAVDLRPTGVRVGGTGPALSVVLESPDPSAVQPFWQQALGYDDALVDPLRRDPRVRIEHSDEARPVRHRVHLDVVRPAAQVESFGAGGGPWGLRHADADGNEVDLVPGDPLGESPSVADWQQVFSAMACYRVEAPAELARAAANIADDAGFPLLIDVRPGLVVLDSGKDRWDADAHGLDVDFEDFAADLQRAARDLGAVADQTLPRFVQLFLDAADVDAVRAFWVETLGYERDRREGVSDIHDPHRLNPSLVFQTLDTTETERLAQRNRIYVELAVPEEQVQRRVEQALTAGGRLLEPGRVADPEGNELAFVAGG